MALREAVFVRLLVSALLGHPGTVRPWASVALEIGPRWANVVFLFVRTGSPECRTDRHGLLPLRDAETALAAVGGPGFTVPVAASGNSVLVGPAGDLRGASSRVTDVEARRVTERFSLAL